MKETDREKEQEGEREIEEEKQLVDAKQTNEMEGEMKTRRKSK